MRAVLATLRNETCCTVLLTGSGLLIQSLLSTVPVAYFSLGLAVIQYLIVVARVTWRPATASPPSANPVVSFPRCDLDPRQLVLVNSQRYEIVRSLARRVGDAVERLLA